MHEAMPDEKAESLLGAIQDIIFCLPPAEQRSLVDSLSKWSQRQCEAAQKEEHQHEKESPASRL